MGLRKFLSRRKVLYSTPELAAFIKRWLQNDGWKFENFADFMELVGLKTPVTLSNFNKKTGSFKCLTANNSEFVVSISFGNLVDYCSRITLENKYETKTFETNIYSQNASPAVTLTRRTIKRNGKELSCEYSEYYCTRILKLDDIHTLSIHFKEPSKSNQISETMVLRNSNAIEAYLLDLDKSLDVSNVYGTIIDFLGFTLEDISNSSLISISYLETINQSEHTRSKIALEKGKMQEYAIFENGETFHVFRDGRWRYLSDNISIFYFAEMKTHNFSIVGGETDIISANPAKIMGHVKKKISELQKFIK